MYIPEAVWKNMPDQLKTSIVKFMENVRSHDAFPSAHDRVMVQGARGRVVVPSGITLIDDETQNSQVLDYIIKVGYDSCRTRRELQEAQKIVTSLRTIKNLIKEEI